MIDFYFWTTPNGYKVLMFLEETRIPYRITPVNISKGQQFDPGFLEISPNNKIPAIVDHHPVGGGDPIAVFESGAILLYLAEKTGRLISSDTADRADELSWLFWQVGGLGPMLGQNLHFGTYAPDSIPYAIDRYVKETRRLFHVLNNRLAGREFISRTYSIADVATYPWILKHPSLHLELDDFSHLKRWFYHVAARPATDRSYKKGATINTIPTITEESKALLLGQTAPSLAH